MYSHYCFLNKQMLIPNNFLIINETPILNTLGNMTRFYFRYIQCGKKIQSNFIKNRKKNFIFLN